MKIKAVILTSILSLVSLSAFCDQGGVISGGGDGQNEFRMFLPPVSIYIQNSEINTAFRGNLGVVDITIKNGNGFIIYKESVDTSITNHTSFDTFGLPSDSYSIVITDNYNRPLAFKTLMVD